MTTYNKITTLSLSILGCIPFSWTTAMCSLPGEQMLTPVAKSGLRYGFGLGGEYTLNNIISKKDPTLIKSDSICEPKDNETAFEFSPHLEIGYHFQNGFYLGGIATYHYSPNLIKCNNVLQDDNRQDLAPTFAEEAIRHIITTATRQYSFSTLLKFGYQVKSTVMVYGLAGATFSKWKRNVSTFINTELDLIRSYSYNATGLKVGAGVEWQATDSLSLSMDWSHTIYKKGRNGLAQALGVRQNCNTVSIKISYFL